ncbi:MAG: DUF5305 domain-containing protein [Tenericutes bacterium]|nr:DUF5305 domain-containing protein [Mycoplasmatota bacterium]
MKNNENNTIINKKKYVFQYILLFVVILFLCFSSFIMIKKGFNNYQKINIDYVKTSKINYKVHLKDNNFFDDSFLDENKIYITSLIDNLDISFNYNMNYSEFVSGKYSYYIVATVSANIINNTEESYWSKDYRLTDEKTSTFSSQNMFDITENIKVDYQNYNEILSLFKKTYGLSTDGNLKIKLVVSSTVSSDKISEEIIFDSVEELDIPLSQLSVEVKINTNNNKVKKSVSEKETLNDPIYLVLKVAGISTALLSVALTIILVNSIRRIKKHRDLYVSKLKKILSTYDSIIVNSETLPQYDEKTVVKVKSFEELMDAHSEVRMPINFIENKKRKKSTFMLISPSCTWIYVLNEDDL